VVTLSRQARLLLKADRSSVFLTDLNSRKQEIMTVGGDGTVIRLPIQWS